MKGEKLSDSGQEKSFIMLSGKNIIYEDENSLQNFQLWVPDVGLREW